MFKSKKDIRWKRKKKTKPLLVLLAILGFISLNLGIGFGVYYKIVIELLANKVVESDN
jgi:hypothetical protein